MGLFGRKKYDEDGYDEEGYDGKGFDKRGRSKKGFDMDGYDMDGYDKKGREKKPENVKIKKEKRNWGRGNIGFCRICEQKVLKDESYTKIEDSKDIHYGEMRHKQCEDNLQKTEKDAKHNENFKKIIQAFDTKFEALIEIKYDKSRQSNLRYFFGHEDNEITRSKDFIVNIDSNYLYMCIIPTEHEFLASWNKPKGNFNIGDNYDSGYSGIISFKSEDKELRSEIIKIFMNNGFGCLPGTQTIHAHKNDETPNIQEAEKLLRIIIDDIENYFLKSE